MSSEDFESLFGVDSVGGPPMSGPDDVPVSSKDPRFAAAVGSVLDSRLPNVVSLEGWLSVRGLVVVGSLLGVLSLLLWKFGPYIVTEKLLRPAIKGIMADGLEQDVDKRVSGISKSLHDTFGSQVDSGTYKVLKFGCTPMGAARSEAFPECSPEPAAVQLRKADQQILVVANPRQQTIRLSVSAYSSNPDSLESLLLEISAESAPLQENLTGNRRILEIKPDHVASNGADLTKDGRLLLLSPSGMLNAEIDLTPTLAQGPWRGAILLRFSPVLAVPSTGTEHQPSTSRYQGPTGKELFFLRTVTTVFHSIPAVPSATEK